jgi:hypothetical protein
MVIIEGIRIENLRALRDVSLRRHLQARQYRACPGKPDHNGDNQFNPLKCCFGSTISRSPITEQLAAQAAERS